jgi:hypothetical protein
MATIIGRGGVPRTTRPCRDFAGEERDRPEDASYLK